MNSESHSYFNLLLSKTFDLSYNELNKNMYLVNGELPSKLIDKSSSKTDLVVRFNNYDFIIEMNYYEKDYTLEKNNSYLFNLHISKIFDGNLYGKNIYNLLSIDDYDVLGEKDLIYESELVYQKYNRCMYNNIKLKYINLASLRNKYYNKIELNDLENLLLIFIEQRKDIILNLFKFEKVKGIIRIMEKLKLDNKLPTYNYEELERKERENFNKKIY